MPVIGDLRARWRAREVLEWLKPTEGHKLIDRGTTVLRLYKALAAGEHVYLFGVAGVGKTSLIHTALAGERQRLKDNLPLSLPLHDLDSEQRAAIAQLRSQVLAETPVVIYEISEIGDLLLRRQVSPDNLPKNGSVERAIVVVDEFHRLGWFPGSVQQRIIEKIGGLFDRANRLQIVFSASLPVYSYFPVSHTGVVFDWLRIPGMDREPLHIWVPPIHSGEDVTFQTLLNNLRGDVDRRSNVEVPDVRLLEPPIGIGDLEPYFEDRSTAYLLARVVDHEDPEDTEGVLNRLHRLAQDFRNVCHPIIGLRLPESPMRSGRSLQSQRYSMTQVGRESRFFPEYLTVWDVVIDEEGHGDFLQWADQMQNEGQAIPPEAVYTLLNANNMIFLQYTRDRARRIWRFMTRFGMYMLLMIGIIFSHWAALRNLLPNEVALKAEHLYSHAFANVLSYSHVTIFSWVMTCATYFAIAWLYMTISPVQIVGYRYRRLSAAFLGGVSIFVVTVLMLILDIDRATIIYVAGLSTIVFVLLAIFVPVVLAYLYEYILSANVSSLVQLPPFYVPSSLREASDQVFSSYDFTFIRIASTLWTMMWISIPFLYTSAIPSSIRLVWGYVWITLLVLSWMFAIVSYRNMGIARPYGQISSLKRLLLLLLLSVVIADSMPFMHILSILAICLIWLLWTLLVVPDSPLHSVMGRR